MSSAHTTCVGLIAGLCACGARMLTDTSRVDESEAVLVTTIVSNFAGTLEIDNLDGKAFASPDLALQNGETIVVVAMSPGKYRWKAAHKDKEVAYIRGDYTFELQANAINYVGDLRLTTNWDANTLHVEVVDNGDATRSWMQDKYPRLSAAHRYVKDMTGQAARRWRDPDPVLDQGEAPPGYVNPRAMIAQAIGTLRAFRDQMCACADTLCTEDVYQRLTRWSRERDDAARPTNEEQVELNQLRGAIKTCMANAVREPSATVPP